MHGFDRLTGCFLIDGARPALIETGPKSTVPAVLEQLAAGGIQTLDWIVVTHIHLDHAGAAGTLARHFPDARVAVHEVGAPHLIDPSKLWASATRIYGDRMEELWGGIDPIPEDRIMALSDGDVVDLGDGRKLEAVDTPGHARHHHAYLDDVTGSLFAGDALGVRLPDIGVIRPATPPPEFDLEDALASIDRIRELHPRQIWLTHFGPVDQDLDTLCDEAQTALETWAKWVEEARMETAELDRAAKLVETRARADMEARVDPQAAARMSQATSYWMNTWGYMRYFDKKGRTAAE
ncbi:MAG TPA: MBL fold metallo-hydrolase [Actinomycetota bacterium]|nr:MBL fold metallo-hydrolase [Actinomycetota bacterium]